MKKLTLSLVAAGLTTASLGAYAATATGAAPFQVMVPNLKSGLEFTLEGLYLQPTNSDLVYVASVTNTGSVNTLNNTALKPEYDFGFGVGLGYVFPNSGNDVQLKWQHFNQSTTDNTVINGGANSGAFIAGFPFSIPSGSSLNATSEVTNKYDSVDLDMGQYLSLGTRLQTRLFAGLRFAQLQENITYTYAAMTGSTTTGTISGTTNSKFTGLGPRLGIDTSYHVANCFGVVAHFATALLVGRVESNGTIPASSGFGGFGGYSYTADNQTRVVPAFDGKLGFDYTIGFNNGTSNLVVEAGYQVTQYVDAIDRAHFAYPMTISTETSSIGFNGPYLSLNFKI